jgi:hypothetical protein
MTLVYPWAASTIESNFMVTNIIKTELPIEREIIERLDCLNTLDFF